jgi:APA family basic amino acid/polyamine antiporter
MPYGPKSGPLAQWSSDGGGGDHLLRLTLRRNGDRRRSEESRRDLSIGIVGSMFVCVIIYMAVAATAIGALATPVLPIPPAAGADPARDRPARAAAPRRLGRIALPTVILPLLRPEPTFFVGARRPVAADLARVSGCGSPVRITIFTR